MAREALVARTFVELADSLVDDFDVVELLTLLADRCVDIFDVAAAGLMLASPEGELRVLASSSEASAHPRDLRTAGGRGPLHRLLPPRGAHCDP